MIIYFDILQLDSKSFLGTRQTERFKALSQFVVPVQGRAALFNAKSSTLNTDQPLPICGRPFRDASWSGGKAWF